jgi:tetratricopeptide (TPR) repeat protein
LGEAEAKVRAGLTIQEKLVQDFPTVPRYRQDFAASHFSLGFLLANLQKWVEAEAAYRAALVIQERLVADFPRSTAYRKDFALSHNYLGSLLIAIGKRVEAEAEFRAALMIQEKLVADYPLVPDYQNDLAGTLLNLAALHFKRQDFAAAVQLLEQALPSHKAALAANPENPTYRHYYRNNLLVLTESRLELGDHARASDTADEMAKFAYEPANDAYNAACFLCRCATLGEMDAKLGDDRRKELTNTYVERALALLRQAVERGFKEAAHMKQDSDLEVLRTREEFKQLIAEIEGTQ